MSSSVLAYLKKIDWILAGAAGFLALFGIVELVGMAHNNPEMALREYKQILALALGIAGMMVLSLFDYRFFRNNTWAVVLLYLGSLALLGLLLLVGEQTRGLVGWFRVGEFAFAPVEATKIVMALLFAKYFSVRHIELYRFFHLAVSLAYVALPSALVLLQPDLGSALIIFALWLSLMLFAGISTRQLAALLGSGAAVLWLSWAYALKEYQKERIFSFLNPYGDPQGSGYNAIQSMIAVGDGGWFGKGLGYGSQVQLGFLPEAHTDFMFASVAEEFGFVGVVIIFLLAGIVLWRIASIALSAENNFARLFCVGMMLLVSIHMIVNMGMNIGLMPVIGITFPFLSYGGSSLVSLFLGLGLVQSIKVRS